MNSAASPPVIPRKRCAFFKRPMATVRTFSPLPSPLTRWTPAKAMRMQLTKIKIPALVTMPLARLPLRKSDATSTVARNAARPVTMNIHDTRNAFFSDSYLKPETSSSLIWSIAHILC